MGVRVLGITETCDLGSLYLRLLGEGHEVRISISEPLAHGTMAGLVPRVDDWKSAGHYRDIYEFVESIPFTETREYVQAIMRNAQIYQELYGGKSSSAPAGANGR